VMNLRLAYTWRFGSWEATALARLENATDRSYAGSVIVNEANRRFFEPAPPRNALGALTMRYRF
jgi:iron complex outermembrane receptor protein